MKPAALLISGTDTEVGKTKIACDLAQALTKRGIRVGVMKPAETGCEFRDGQYEPVDALALRAASGCQTPLEIICPYRYRAPLAPAAAAEIEGAAPPDLAVVQRCFAVLADDHEIVLVEGAGGLAVPISWETNYADLAVRLELSVMLVVANRLGCINSAVLSIEYAELRGARVCGYVLNDARPAVTPATATNSASLRRLLRAECLGEVHHGHSLAQASVDRIAALLHC